MEKKMTEDWQHALANTLQQTYVENIIDQVKQQRTVGEVIYPAEKDVFSAFKITSLKKVKVVILGQDPYHGAGQAHGLSFSVLPNVKVPPSLRNMYKELAQDIEGFEIPQHGYLQSWAEQGVLLLNAVLTVKEGQPNSHKSLGWEKFTDEVIKVISENKTGVIFLLWGSQAQKKAKLIDKDKHHILNGPHPSPLSAHRGFFGCKHFSTANQLLEKQGQKNIDWHLPRTTDDNLLTE